MDKTRGGVVAGEIIEAVEKAVTRIWAVIRVLSRKEKQKLTCLSKTVIQLCVIRIFVLLRDLHRNNHYDNNHKYHYRPNSNPCLLPPFSDVVPRLIQRIVSVHLISRRRSQWPPIVLSISERHILLIRTPVSQFWRLRKQVSMPLSGRRKEGTAFGANMLDGLRRLPILKGSKWKLLLGSHPDGTNSYIFLPRPTNHR